MELEELSIEYHEHQVRILLATVQKEAEKKAKKTVKKHAATLIVGIHLLSLFRAKRSSNPRYTENNFRNYIRKTFPETQAWSDKWIGCLLDAASLHNIFDAHKAELQGRNIVCERQAREFTEWRISFGHNGRVDKEATEYKELEVVAIMAIAVQIAKGKEVKLDDIKKAVQRFHSSSEFSSEQNSPVASPSSLHFLRICCQRKT